jgi:murein DD-endopeptidase MepM/ murein hydrolase activator NlpD
LANQRITIVVTSGKGGWTYTASMSRPVALAAALAAALVVIGLVTTLALYGRVATVAARAASLERENAELRAENERVKDLEADVDRLRSFEAKILAIMGIDSLAVPGEPSDQASGTGGGADSPGRGQGPVQFRWPTRGVISRGYKAGPGTGAPHMGLDIAAELGAPVVAALSGRVVFAGVDSVFGNEVVIDHGNTLTSLYGHNSKLLVKVGDMVRGGQLIARVGSTGRSSAPHLHFEVRRGERAVDPLKYLQKKR